MAKFRKKPIVIEAFQWFGDHRQEEDPEWIIKAIKEKTVIFRINCMLIETLEGLMRVDEGDYVIQGIKGEIYPCKPDIFVATYEKVEE